MRNVVVTGGSRGLGLAMVQRLAAAGYRVIAIARTCSEALAAEIQSRRADGMDADGKAADARGAVEFRACDLADLKLIPPLVRGMRAEFGPLYGLINNAGLGSSNVLGNMRDADIESVIKLNTVSPIIMTKYVVRSMLTVREGRIISIASVVASTGYSGLSVYSASKSSLIGFTRSLAREVGQLGITANVIAPGFIDTDMTKELTAAQRDQIINRSALRRLADATDVAGSAEYLLSDAGRNITGTVLTVDAGNTA
jgi:3-oxoacyl-[acyl-carrier protein] reductase